MRTKLHFVISKRSPAGNCEKTRSILLVIRSTRKLDNLILDPPLLLLWRKTQNYSGAGTWDFPGTRTSRKLQGNERGTFDSVGIKSCPIRRCIQNTFFSATFSY